MERYKQQSLKLRLQKTLKVFKMSPFLFFRYIFVGKEGINLNFINSITNESCGKKIKH